MTLTTEQLYRLNDVLTAALAEMGWTAESEEDFAKLNDAVHEIAGRFFADPEASTPDLLDPEGSGYVAEPPWDA